MDYTTNKIIKVCLSVSVAIMLLLGFLLVIIGDKDEDMGMGCFLMIFGFMFYYLVSCLVLNKNVYRSIDADELDNKGEFNL
jgi:hypothetical protein